MILRSVKFTQKYQSKRYSDFQKQYRACQEKLRHHFSKKRGENVVKSCTDRQLRKSEEDELNAILDPILNTSKPGKVCKFIERDSGKKSVVCKGVKLVGESFKKSIRRFKVEGFVCVPSLYKYDKEDPKLVRTRSDSCVHYKEYTSFSSGCFWDRKKPTTATKISLEDHHRSDLKRSEVLNVGKIFPERLPTGVTKPNKPADRPIAESGIRIFKDTLQKPMKVETFCKQPQNLQTSSSGSIDDMMVKQFTLPIRETPKIRHVTNKIMESREKRYSNLLESIKQSIAAIKEGDLHNRATVMRQLNRERVGEDESGVKMQKQGLLRIRNPPEEQKRGKKGSRGLESLEPARVVDVKKSTLKLPKIKNTSKCLKQIGARKQNHTFGISDTSSGSYKTANSVRSQANQSNLSESTDIVECEAPKKLTGGRSPDGKTLHQDEFSDGKPVKIGRNPERTPLRVMNYSFEGHVTLPAKSNVREMSKSQGIPIDTSELSIGIGRMEVVKKDGQYGSNFGLKASKSHFDLTTPLRGAGRQHCGRRK